MRLRDLVANSLPRMRGKKKKSPTPEVETGQRLKGSADPALQHGGGNFSTLGAYGVVGEVVAETEWRENALYRGLDKDGAGRDGTSGRRVMSHSYSTHGMVSSHSAEGFSQFMLMSRSYDSRMAVSEYAGSRSEYDGSRSEYGGSTASNMAVVADRDARPLVLFESQQQQLQHQEYNCHVHRHNHQHHHYYHHHHHHHPLQQGSQQQPQPPHQPMKVMSQNQQTCLKDPHTPGVLPKQETAKQEPGFFRKSLASFRSMRKHSSRSSKENSQSGQNLGEASRCSVCPYPEAGSNGEKKNSDKRPAKPKRKGLKTFSKSKENKSHLASDNCDRVWYSDNEARGPLVPMVTCDNSGPYHVTLDRPRTRECSMESCSSRLYSSRESSCVRDTDLAGFDSASLSGYESDLPRGAKVHRSRSRIKTNPWLPSPQPSLSGGRRAESCDLSESKEDLFLRDGQRSVPRSASFEHQRKPLTAVPIDMDCERRHTTAFVQRNRSFTPIDMSKLTLPIDRAPKPKSTPDKPKPSSDKPISKRSSKTDSDALNDLNSSLPRSRPSSIVSPNSEFIILTDNLEQLANNISFEYEEMLDSTLESVSVCQEDGKAEFLTDDDTLGSGSDGSKRKSYTNGQDKNGQSPDGQSSGPVGNAYSPDSGVGGLGASDGDDLASSPNANKDAHSMLSEHKNLLFSMESPTVMKSQTGNSNSCSRFSNDHQYLPSTETTPKPGALLGFGAKRKYYGIHNSERLDFNIQKQPTTGGVEDSVAICESDIDNTSYLDTIEGSSHNEKCSKILDNGGKHVKQGDKGAVGTEKTKQRIMVEEKLDAPFNPLHHHHHHHHKHHHQQQNDRHGSAGPSIVMGSRMSMQETSTATSRLSVSSSMLSSQPEISSATSLTPSQLQRLSSHSDGAQPKLARPSVLVPSGKISLGHGVRRRTRTPLNDIEKDSSQGGAQGGVQDERPWSGEFDIPRNIVLSETVESPTENIQCDDRLLVICPELPEVHSKLNASALVSDSRIKGKDSIPTDVSLMGEILVVDLPKLSSLKPEAERKVEEDKISNEESAMDFEREGSVGTETLSEMTDACCQTDFQDDFSQWEESTEKVKVKPIDCLTEKEFDPTESTRLWLLTGNMQGSADTGYSSLARDSRVFSDIFSEEDAAAIFLMEEEKKSPHSTTDLKCVSGSRSLEAHNESSRPAIRPSSFEATTKQGKHSIYGGGAIVTTDKNGEFKFRKSPLSENKPFVDGPKGPKVFDSVLVQRAEPSQSSTSKNSSNDRVNQMFSNIENQFQEIFLQIYSHKKSVPDPRSHKGLLADAKNISTDVPSVNMTKLSKCADRYANTREIYNQKLSGPEHCPVVSKNLNPIQDIDVPAMADFSEHTYVNVSDTRVTPSDTHPLLCDAWVPPPRPVTFIKPLTLPNEENLDGSYEDIWRSISPDKDPSSKLPTSPSTSLPSDPALCRSDRADYLEFLRDAPLDRSHLKRPLFLVPGVGPVDMSSSEQVESLFSHLPILTSPSSQQAKIYTTAPSLSSSPLSPSSSSSSSSTTRRGKHPVSVTNTNSPSMSPSSGHCGKKFKLKKGGQKSMPEHATTKAETGFTKTPATTPDFISSPIELFPNKHFLPERNSSSDHDVLLRQSNSPKPRFFQIPKTDANGNITCSTVPDFSSSNSKTTSTYPRQSSHNCHAHNQDPNGHEVRASSLEPAKPDIHHDDQSVQVQTPETERPRSSSSQESSNSSSNAASWSDCPSLATLERIADQSEDDATRTLAQRVVFLRREKELVYRKIQAAQEEQMSRQQQRLQFQRELHVQRKQALLDTLHELKVRLEEQSRRLHEQQQKQQHQQHQHPHHQEKQQQHQQQQQKETQENLKVTKKEIEKEVLDAQKVEEFLNKMQPKHEKKEIESDNPFQQLRLRYYNPRPKKQQQQTEKQQEKQETVDKETHQADESQQEQQGMEVTPARPSEERHDENRASSCTLTDITTDTSCNEGQEPTTTATNSNNNDDNNNNSDDISSCTSDIISSISTISNISTITATSNSNNSDTISNVSSITTSMNSSTLSNFSSTSTDDVTTTADDVMT